MTNVCTEAEKQPVNEKHPLSKDLPCQTITYYYTKNLYILQLFFYDIFIINLYVKILHIS